MESGFKKIRIKYLIYLCIVLLQVIFVLYWAVHKQNYFIDELYSMEHSSEYTEVGGKALYLTLEPNWEFNKWLDNAEYKRHFIVLENEKITKLSLFDAIKSIIGKRNYNGLLNLAMSLFGYDIPSARPGIMLNLVLFIITELLLIMLLSKLKLDERIIYISLAMFGFSGYMISVTNYIRFYSIVALFIMVMLNLIYAAWSSKRIWKVILADLFLFITVYLSFKDAELSAVFFGSLCISYTVYMIVNKDWKRLIPILLMLAIVVLYVATQTHYLEVILNPGRYSNNSVLLGVSNSLRRISFAKVTYMLNFIICLFIDYYFGDFSTLAISGMLICIYVLRDDEKKAVFSENTYMVNIRTIKVVFAMGILLTISVFINKGTRTAVIALIAVMVYAFKRQIFTKLAIHKFGESINSGFIKIISGAVAIYTIFFIMAGLDNWRHYLFGFIVVQIIIWYLIDGVLKNRTNRGIGIYLVLYICVVLFACTPFFTRNVENIYEDDAYLKNIVERYNSYDAVIATHPVEGYGTSTHEVYDCVNQMSSDSRLYIVNTEAYTFQDIDYGYEFILWSHKNDDVTNIVNDLEQNGYKVEELGTNHVSRVYLCSNVS